MSEYIEHDRERVSVGIVEKKQFTFAAPPNAMELESGARLGPVTIAYETYGSLAPDRSNAVLVLHALSGDSHVAGYYAPADEKPGWWDCMVGPGKGIDTDRYFVVCANIIGSCMGSTGPFQREPRHRPGLRPGLPGGHHRRHGRSTEGPHRPPGHRETPVRGRGLDRRHAGAGVECPLPGDGLFRHPSRHHHAALGAGHCLQRGRPAGDHGGPALESRQLLRR